MSKTSLRFGFHDFLNAQPLLIPLSRLARQAGIEIVLSAPATVAAKLRAGEIDLGMIPSVEYLKEANHYRLLPGVAIASRGAVETVLLVTQTPLEEIRTLALDNRSLTSVALLRILFADKLHSQTQFQNSVPDLKTMLESNDAALIIGDQAFLARDQFPESTFYDLSDEWFRRTGKTFVHAVTAVRSETTIDKETLDLLQQIQSEENIPEIAKTWAEKIGISEAKCLDYMTNKIIYQLGKAELEGLTHFRGLCLERGVIDQEHPVRFVGS